MPSLLTRGCTCAIAFSLFSMEHGLFEFWHLLFLKLRNFFNKLILFRESNFQLILKHIRSLVEFTGGVRSCIQTVVQSPTSFTINDLISPICNWKHRTFSVHVSSLTIYFNFLLYQNMISPLTFNKMIIVYIYTLIHLILFSF